MRTLLCLVALAALALASSTPSFCHGLNCPAYSVVSTNATANVEIRDYSNSTGTWVRAPSMSIMIDSPLQASVNITGMDYTTAISEGFMKLFKYIQGANVGNHSVEMAAPVLVEVRSQTRLFTRLLVPA